MKMEVKCICGNTATTNGICDECKCLLRARQCKNLEMFEKIRSAYNLKRNTYKTYGQFVAYIDAIYRRKRSFDNTRKKATVKKIWSNG